MTNNPDKAINNNDNIINGIPVNDELLIKDSIDRAYDLTKEVFNRIRFD